MEDNNKKIKVAWVCWVSNSEIRESLTFSRNVVDFVLRKIMHKPRRLDDYTTWVTNGIEEFKHIDDIEIHVISLHSHIDRKLIEFQKAGIFYHFFKSEDDLTVVGKYINKITGKYVSSNYEKNKKTIQDILNRVNPDIIHLFGAESPQYGAFALDVDVEKTPFIVSMQTIMSDPEFIKKYPISEESYVCRVGMERRILEHAKYLSTNVKSYRDFAWKEINPDAVIFNVELFLGEKLRLEECAKKYDFVYFSWNINKAVDLAIEAFAVAKKTHPEIKMLVIGEYEDDFKRQIDARISELGVTESIVFTGKLQTHDDLINKVKQSRFALLPLKIDFITCTIRESMACGLPVVTTITSGTPTLNENRESVLLSEIGDHEALAANMVRLLESEDLAKTLVDNALVTLDEKYGNRRYALKLVNVYKALLAKYTDGTDIPEEYYSLNPYR